MRNVPLTMDLKVNRPLLAGMKKCTPGIGPRGVIVVKTESLSRKRQRLVGRGNVGMCAVRRVSQLKVAGIVRRSVACLGREGASNIRLSLSLSKLSPRSTPNIKAPIVKNVDCHRDRLTVRVLTRSRVVASTRFMRIGPVLSSGGGATAITITLVNSLFNRGLLWVVRVGVDEAWADSTRFFTIDMWCLFED